MCSECVAILRLPHAYHGVSEGLLHQVDAALIHRLTIGQEATLQGSGHRWQALSETGRGWTQSAACPYNVIIAELGLTLCRLTYLFMHIQHISDSPLVRGRGLCLHLSAGSTFGSVEASASGCIPDKQQSKTESDKLMTEDWNWKSLECCMQDLLINLISSNGI